MALSLSLLLLLIPSLVLRRRPIHADGIDAHAFSEASDGLVGMFDLLGSGVFGFVQSDIRNNIRVRLPSESADPILMLLGRPHALQRPRAAHDRGGDAPRLGRRPRRAGAPRARAAFTCVALQNMQAQPARDLYGCFKASYDSVLKHHHSFVIRSVVYVVALRAVPHRKDFYEGIAQGAPHDKLDEELRKWLAGLDTIVIRLKVFLKEGGFGSCNF
ncbi:glycolipid transfer protein [Hymenopellis radicata]|nr:glycolipid transfer protein [Hymenopellis radicata]